MAYNIKTLGPNRNSRYKQGYFDKYNPQKYFGSRPIIYRSSLELMFMRKCEMNSSVEQWSSEQVVIPYTMQEKINGKFVTKRHNYHTDFSLILKNGIKYIIEVKPKGLTPLNESDLRTNFTMYRNACKWKAAIAWCKLNGYIFKIINEEQLKTKVFN
jgi:hypothetical protein